MCCLQTQRGVFTAASVERLNVSLRTWLPSIVRFWDGTLDDGNGGKGV
jgi:hypothetical protein